MIDDEMRWRAAVSLANGNPTPEAEELLARQRRIRWRWLSVLIVVAVLAGVVIGLLSGSRNRGRRSSTADIAAWRIALGWSLWGLGLVLAVLVLIRAQRSGRFRLLRRSPFLILTRAQRRGLVRQVRGQAAVDPEHLPVSRFLATTLVTQRQSVLGLVPLALLVVGNAVRSDRVILSVYAAAIVVLLIVVRVASVPQIVRARRFLETCGAGGQTPEQVTVRPGSDA